MKRSDWGGRKNTKKTTTRRVEHLNNSTLRVVGTFSIYTPPIATLHWGLFTFNPADYNYGIDLNSL